MKFRYISGLFLLVLSVAGLIQAQESVCAKGARPDCPRALLFFHAVQAALQHDDRRALASMVRYPLLTWIHSKRTHIATQKRFLLLFDEIFDKSIRCQILNASDADFVGNYSYGYSVGTGAIWFDDRIPPGGQTDVNAPDFWTRYPFKIVTVNNEFPLPCTSGNKEHPQT